MSCTACFQGAVRQDKQPTGHVKTFDNRNTYIAEPPGGNGEPTGIIVIVPDAFGWEFTNNRLLADEYTRKGGFRVYLPDFMDGTAAPLWVMEDLDAIFDVGYARSWLWKPYHIARALYGMGPFIFHNRISASLPKVTSFLSALQRSNAGTALPIGVAGFCWGGQHVIRLAVDSADLPSVDALFTAHPSMLSVPSDIERVRRPLSIAVGDKDHLMPLQQVQVTEAVLRRNRVKHEVVVYEGAGHGFSVRIDRTNPKQEEQAVRAEEQAVEWFKKCFEGK